VSISGILQAAEETCKIDRGLENVCGNVRIYFIPLVGKVRFEPATPSAQVQRAALEKSLLELKDWMGLPGARSET
jgi:hypothetical protein